MQLEFTKAVKSRLRGYLLASRRMEIGGVLMGEQITPGHFRIVDFSVDTKSGDNSRFIRRPEHHREALDAFFAKTEADYSRFNYLGEWHSHPSYEARPSQQDVAEMRSLVEEEEGIPFSVLLIVRTRWCIQLDYSALLFQRGGHIQEVSFV